MDRTPAHRLRLDESADAAIPHTAAALQFMDGLFEVESFHYDELKRIDLLMARTVEAERDYMAKHPGLRDLWFDRRASDGVVAVHSHYRELTAARMRETIGLMVVDPGSPLHYTMLLEQVGALWDLAFSLDPAGHPEVVAEILALEMKFIGARSGR